MFSGEKNNPYNGIIYISRVQNTRSTLVGPIKHDRYTDLTIMRTNYQLGVAHLQMLLQVYRLIVIGELTCTLSKLLIGWKIPFSRPGFHERLLKRNEFLMQCCSYKHQSKYREKDKFLSK